MIMKWRFPTPSGFPPLSAVFFLSGSLFLLFITAPIVEFSTTRTVDAWNPMINFLRHMLVLPDLGYLGRLARNLLETVEMTLLATAIAALISLPTGILAARNATPHPIIYHLTRESLCFMRALPEIVWALVFVSAAGLGPLPGVMALSFVTVGFMAKFVAESIEVVGEKSIEGILATGSGRLQTVNFAMIPQALPDFAGTLIYILDHNLRAAAILGLVGAGGIGYDLVMAMRLFNYSRIILIAVSIYLIVTLLDRLSNILRKRIITGKVHGGR